MPEAIIARGVHVKRDQRPVLTAVDFTAHHGELSVIVGPNGAGKSTLLKAIAGLVQYSGTITVDGLDCAPLAPKERARLMAFVPQQTQLRAPMPVRDVVAQGRYARSTGTLKEADLVAVERACVITDVQRLAHRAFTELSGGEQRRVLVARALAADARVLLFDEPTAALDVRQALSLYRIAREQAQQGVAVVMVLHQLGHALRFADRAVLLHEGRVVGAGVPREVITAAAVRDVYGVELIDNAAPAFEMLSPQGAP